MDIVTKNKAAKYGIGRGFDKRAAGSKPKTLLIHTTNGKPNTTYNAERNYIYTSPKIASHYLIGKQGQITQFLDDKIYRAWHAGAVNNSLFNNNNSIGIECHFTPDEGSWTQAMRDALTWLVRELIKKYGINSPQLIETHRKVAIPKGRKIDPSGFSDIDFYVWRLLLFAQPVKPIIRYKVIRPEINVRYSPRADINNIVGTLYMGDVFESEATKQDEAKQSIKGITTWAHLTRGLGKDALGFVHTSNLTTVG